MKEINALIVVAIQGIGTTDALLVTCLGIRLLCTILALRRKPDAVFLFKMVTWDICIIINRKKIETTKYH